jgi:hypothetical protein
MLGLALPVSAMFISFGVASQLPAAYRPYGVVHAVIGLIVGMLVHYPMATYECLDVMPLPNAQTDDK